MLKLGEIYLRDETKLAEAKSIIKKCIEANPNLAEGYIQLGRIYEKEDKDGEALESFNKALEISNANKKDKKSNLNVHFFLGCIYERQKDMK